MHVHIFSEFYQFLKFPGQLLKMVAEMTQAKSILEIGTYTGYGAVTLAETSLCVNSQIINLFRKLYFKFSKLVSFIRKR